MSLKWYWGFVGAPFRNPKLGSKNILLAISFRSIFSTIDDEVPRISSEPKLPYDTEVTS